MREMNARGAFVLGVLGLFFGIFAPFALRRGLRSLRIIRRSRGQLTGETLALGAIAMGVLGTVAMVVGIGYWLYAAF